MPTANVTLTSNLFLVFSRRRETRMAVNLMLSLALH